MKYILSADIGVNTINMALFNQFLELKHTWSIDVSNNTENKIFKYIRESFDATLKIHNLSFKDILGCGISINISSLGDNNLCIYDDIYITNILNLPDTVKIVLNTTASQSQNTLYDCATSILKELYGCKFIDLMEIVGCENIVTNVYGKDITTFKIGGRIKYFVTPKNLTALVNLFKHCKENNLKYFVIGEGSNLLIDDNGYDGIMISLKNLYHPPIVKDAYITATASTTLKEVSEVALENSLSGIEFYHDIPGSVGGGLFMNCGAYGCDTSHIVHSATIVTENADIKTLTNVELELSYRSSSIKKYNFIVVDVTYKLNKSDKQTIKEILDDLYQKRIEKQPLEYPSAGSTFKRPLNNFAGKLIMDSNLKGTQVGDAMVSKKHAGFIINLNNATSADVEKLIEIVIDTVFKNFNVKLEPEIIILK